MNAVDAAAAPEPGLVRSLSFWDLVLYGLAYIAPFAPLSTLGFVWKESNGLIVLAYALGGVCMYLTAQSYATMTEALPTAGSVYAFARQSLGPLAGFVAGWMILLDYLLVPAFVYVFVAVSLDSLLPGIGRGIWIVLSVSVTTAVNWFGITVTARANFWSVTLQTVLLLAFVWLCLLALGAGKGNGALTFKPLYEASAFHAAGLFGATSICIMSFLGFDAVSTLAEEVAGGDRRVVGRAIVTVLILATVFFIGLSFVLGNLLPGIAIHDPSAAIYELAAWATGPWMAAILAWAAATVVGLSNTLPMQVGVARVVFAMGRDRQLPAALGRVHPRHRTPHVAMLVTAAISLAVALVMQDHLDDLASVVNFGALSGFLFLHVSVWVTFGLVARSRRWFRHWLVPAGGALVVIAVFSGMSALATEVGVAWLVLGLVYGVAVRVQRGASPPAGAAANRLLPSLRFRRPSLLLRSLRSLRSGRPSGVLQRLRSWRHGFWYAVSERIGWSRGTHRETPAGELPALPEQQAQRISGLRMRYDVRFEVRQSVATSLNNYEYLDILDTAFLRAGAAIPSGGVLCDVGCASFWYAPTLAAFFRPDRMFGVEVEGHRLFKDGRARIDYARGYLADLPRANFVVADYTCFDEPADVITAWFPFVTPAAILAWRLPLGLLQPARLFRQIEHNLAPGGIFVMVNHGRAEAAEAHALCAAAGLVAWPGMPGGGWACEGVLSGHRPARRWLRCGDARIPGKVVTIDNLLYHGDGS